MNSAKGPIKYFSSIVFVSIFFSLASYAGHPCVDSEAVVKITSGKVSFSYELESTFGQTWSIETGDATNVVALSSGKITEILLHEQVPHYKLERSLAVQMRPFSDKNKSREELFIGGVKPQLTDIGGLYINLKTSSSQCEGCIVGFLYFTRASLDPRHYDTLTIGSLKYNAGDKINFDQLVCKD